METTRISFSINGSWNGDRNGSGVMTVSNINVPYSAPASLAGPGIGSNPEELLVASVSTCYMITLAAVLSRRGVDYSHLEIDSEGIVHEEGNSLIFKEIIHKPVIYLNIGDNDNVDEKKNEVIQLADRAERACFISKTIKPQVTVSVQPEIRIKK